MRFDEELNSNIFMQDMMEVQQEAFEEWATLMELGASHVEIIEKEEMIKVKDKLKGCRQR